jgi:hypothetical protein
VLTDDYESNYGARLLPLLCAIAAGEQHSEFAFPMSAHSSLKLSLTPIETPGG